MRIEPWDEPALRCLRNVRTELVERGEQRGFALVFEFAKDNEHFANTELCKEFYYVNEYPGVELVRTEGCEIEWRNSNVDATVEMVKKTIGGTKGRRGGRGRGRGGRGAAGGKPRVVMREEPRASFFRTFLDLADDEEEMDEEEMEMIREMEGDHFETACLIRNKLCTNPTDWFTGEAFETLSEELKVLLSQYQSIKGKKPSFSEFMREMQGDEDDEFDGMMGYGEEDDSEDDESDDEDDEEGDGAPVQKGEKPQECQQQQQ
eukprot:TRINITY_DN10000_c0_g1_i1.p1 TRINITY_DN10000_c0_g1~~TRINITY_DN10000_c0_g1_i1.p1  ORF type:complete len:262 (-),score=140.48 TRINITY_DN10000_c0_g1_i1:20-805(-)